LGGGGAWGSGAGEAVAFAAAVALTVGSVTVELFCDVAVEADALPCTPVLDLERDPL